jgi:hypothetical protein
MTLGCPESARPVVKPAPACPTDIDPATEEGHQKIQGPFSADTVDSAAPTLRAYVRMLLWSAPFLSCCHGCAPLPG